jgi:hypothetical protein
LRLRTNMSCPSLIAVFRELWFPKLAAFYMSPRLARSGQCWIATQGFPDR